MYCYTIYHFIYKNRKWKHYCVHLPPADWAQPSPVPQQPNSATPRGPSRCTHTRRHRGDSAYARAAPSAPETWRPRYFLANRLSSMSFPGEAYPLRKTRRPARARSYPPHQWPPEIFPGHHLTCAYKRASGSPLARHDRSGARAREGGVEVANRSRLASAAPENAAAAKKRACALSRRDPVNSDAPSRIPSVRRALSLPPSAVPALSLSLSLFSPFLPSPCCLSLGRE
jgi:hypothetical protein